MRRFLLATAATAALASPALAAAGCTIIDNKGNKLEYIFIDKSEQDNADGSATGVVIEGAYSKNGNDIIQPKGQEPEWSWKFTPRVSMAFSYKADPSFWIDAHSDGAALMHGNNIIGRGSCNKIEDTASAPQAAPPAAAPASAPSAAPVSSLPLVLAGGAMFASVSLGNQPVIMQVDTGANYSVVEESVAGQLLSTGQATPGQSGEVKLADRSTHTVQHIIIGTVTVAGHQAHNVLAGVVPDGSGNLLGLVLMNQISPTFTVDLAKSRILLGS